MVVVARLGVVVDGTDEPDGAVVVVVKFGSFLSQAGGWEP